MNKGECDIQQRLFRFLRWQRNHRWITPNVRSVFSTGECDIFSMTRAGSGYEWEIKTSRSDFKNDAKKGSKYHGGKYELFERRMRGETHFDRKWGWALQHLKQDDPLIVPNYFSYVVPDGLIALNELPDFAGLFYVVRNFYVVEKRRPKKIHAGPMPDNIQILLGEKLMYRFWNERERVTNINPAALESEQADTN